MNNFIFFLNGLASQVIPNAPLWLILQVSFTLSGLLRLSGHYRHFCYDLSIGKYQFN